MSFPKYEKYKDSGVKFLGNIPEHWNVTRLGYLCNKIGSGKTPSGGSETYSDEGVLFVRSQNVYDDGLRLDDVVYISNEIDSEMAVSRVQQGDVLLNITGASLGRTCLVPDKFPAANVNQHVCIIRLTNPQFRNFTAMLMKSSLIKSQIDATQNGAAREGLNFEQISQLRFAIPPIEEQKTIAAFLDTETTKLDALIAEQGRLIELLREKRQAVISHAVTKGLNPTAPLKPSNIPWLGDVPEHWEVTCLKHLCKEITDGAHVSPETEDGVYCFVSTKDICDGVIDFINCLRTSEASYEYLLKTGCKPFCGDVLFSKDGTIGRTVVVEEDREFVVASSLIIIRPIREALDPIYLHHLCQSSLIKNQVDCFVQGAGLPRLSITNLRKVQGSFPPIEEQKEIAKYLETVVKRFDSLITEAERSIELLQERRTALISAAVTGKIDVRKAAC